jgi:DNA polymerase III alpha subunit
MPHVNGPMNEFEDRSDGKVHAPLWIIKGVADAACHAIKEARDKHGDFGTMQDFFERVDKRAVNEGIVKKLLYAGAFDLIEPDIDINEKFREYMYLKRMLKIKANKDKTGQDLRDAVIDFIEKKGLDQEVETDISGFYIEGVEKEIKKNDLVPIYSNNIHDVFREKLKKYIHYGLEKDTPIDTVFIKTGENVVSIRSAKYIKEILDQNSHEPNKIYAWCGLLEEKEDFSYTDKKTKKEVTATKFKIMNDGDYVECIVRPQKRELFKEKGKRDPSEKKIIMCLGTIKEGRGNVYTLSIQDYKEL